MNAAILEREVYTENYEEVRGMIYSIVHRHITQFGGQFNEVLGEANMLFMKAQATYDPDIAKFTTWVYAVINKELFRNRRRDARHRPLPLTQDIPAPTKRPLEELVDGLSVDAKNLVATAIGDPLLPAGIISARNYLKETMLNLGWSIQQFKLAFQEIQEAL